MKSSKNISPLRKDSRITIPRLDYAGLPLAHAFSKAHPGVGVHINSQRIAEVNKGVTAVMMN